MRVEPLPYSFSPFLSLASVSQSKWREVAEVLGDYILYFYSWQITLRPDRQAKRERGWKEETECRMSVSQSIKS